MFMEGGGEVGVFGPNDRLLAPIFWQEWVSIGLLHPRNKILFFFYYFHVMYLYDPASFLLTLVKRYEKVWICF